MHDVRILLLGHCTHRNLLLVVGSAAKGGVCAELLVKSCHLLMLVEIEIISFGYLILIMNRGLWLARLLSILIWSFSRILTYSIVNCHIRFLALEALLLGAWLLICLGNHLLLSERLLVD